MRALLWALSLAAVVLAVQIWWSTPVGVIYDLSVVSDFCKVGNAVVAVGNIYALVDAEGGRLVKNKTIATFYFTRCIAVGDTVYAVGFGGDYWQTREPRLYAIKNGTVVKAVDLAALAGGLATDGQYLYIALNGKRVRVEKRTLDLELVKYVELDPGVVHDVIVHPTTGDIWLSGNIGGPAVVVLDKSLEVKKITKMPDITVVVENRELGLITMQITPLPYYMCVDREGYVYAGADALSALGGFRIGFLLKFDKGGKLLSVFNFSIAAWHIEQRIIRYALMPVVTCIGDYLYVLSTEKYSADIYSMVALYVVDRDFNLLHRFKFYKLNPDVSYIAKKVPVGRPFYDGRYLYMAAAGMLFVVDPSPGDVFYYSPAVGGVYGRGYAVVGNRTIPVEFTPERVYFRGGVPYGAPSVAVYVTHFRLGDVEVEPKGPPYKVYEGPAWPLWTYLDLAAGGATARADVSFPYPRFPYRVVSSNFRIYEIADNPYEVVIYWGNITVARGTGNFSVYLPRTDLIGGRYVAKVYYRGMYIDEKEFYLVRDTAVQFRVPFGVLILHVVDPDIVKAIDVEVTLIHLSNNVQFTAKPGAIMLPPGKYLVRAEVQGRRAEAEVEVKPYDRTELTLAIPAQQDSPTPATTPARTATTPTPAAPRPAAPPATPRPAQPPSAQSASSGAVEQVLALLIIVAIVAASLIYIKKRLSR